jgi:hypothetical protein
MSRWDYNTEAPPPQAYEAVEAAVELIRDAELVNGELYLGSNDQVYAHAEPVDKPENGRWIVVREVQEAGGRRADDTSLPIVKVHVKVVCPRDLPNFARWHAAVHARIAKSLIGEIPVLTRSEAELGYFQQTEPSRPDYYDDTDTYESFAEYGIILQPLATVEP